MKTIDQICIQARSRRSLCLRSPHMTRRWPRMPQPAAAAPRRPDDRYAATRPGCSTSTALVLMMTIPGLALFYGGMVRKKNVLATVMQSFAITCLVTVLWMVDRLLARLHRRRQRCNA